jgi:hypothetical protein
MDRNLTTSNSSLAKLQNRMKHPLNPPPSGRLNRQKRQRVSSTSSDSEAEAVSRVELPSLEEILETPGSNRKAKLKLSQHALAQMDGPYDVAVSVSDQTTTAKLDEVIISKLAGSASGQHDDTEGEQEALKSRSWSQSTTAPPSIAISETKDKSSSPGPESPSKTPHRQFPHPALNQRWLVAPKRQKGLVNQNLIMCYRNATLQLLCGIPQFGNLLGDMDHHEKCRSEHCLICSLDHVRRAMQGLERANVGMLGKLSSDFINKCFERGWAAETVQIGRRRYVGRVAQQDAVDFLGWLVNKIIEDAG